jgi:hypothetical protein
MAGNTLLTVDMITKEALMIAHEKATFIGTINREYDDQFAKDGGGGKIGDTLRIRNPNAYTRRQGSRVMDVQNQSETSQSLTVATQDGVDMKFNSAELSLTIEDFSKRYIEPAVSSLVSAIDGDFDYRHDQGHLQHGGHGGNGRGFLVRRHHGAVPGPRQAESGSCPEGPQSLDADRLGDDGSDCQRQQGHFQAPPTFRCVPRRLLRP